MNKYQVNFNKYREVSQKEFSSFRELVHLVETLLEKKDCNQKIGNAIIVLGFSGNGKSTWINNFCNNHSDYYIISMDSVVNEIYKRSGQKVNPEEIIELFGEQLDFHCSNHHNIIIDGNFLNLLTRCALIDSLCLYNYNINLVDLTPIIEDTILHRICDKVSEDLHVNITIDNLFNYYHYPQFQKRLNEIVAFYQDEKKRSFIEQQKQLNLLSLGIDNLFSYDVDVNDELLVNSTKKKI